MISSSTLYRLGGTFPAADGYAEVGPSIFQTGGEAANSAIVLSRLGMRVRLDGNWIGESRDGSRLVDALRKRRIDISRLTVHKKYAGAGEIVFADRSSRTVFGNYCRILFTKRQWNRPRKIDLAGADIASIDPFFGEESLRAAEYADDAGIPYVTIDCPPESVLARNAAAVVISGEFLRREFEGKTVKEMLKRYRRGSTGLVILTSGEGKIFFARSGGAIQTAAAFSIEPVDTTGAGDAFRAGVVKGLWERWADERIVSYASAVAALVCLSFPGVLKSPSHRAAINFLRRQTKG